MGKKGKKKGRREEGEEENTFRAESQRNHPLRNHSDSRSPGSVQEWTSGQGQTRPDLQGDRPQVSLVLGDPVVPKY